MLTVLTILAILATNVYETLKRYDKGKVKHNFKGINVSI